MPSRGVKVQHLTIALCEALVNMLWESKYKDQERNKTFARARERIIKKSEEIRKFITDEQGPIYNGDVKEIKKVINVIKKEYLLDGILFTPMMGLAIMTDMTLYQITVTSGEKNKLFNQLLNSINYLARYFDPNKQYKGDDLNALYATETMRRLMGV